MKKIVRIYQQKNVTDVARGKSNSVNTNILMVTKYCMYLLYSFIRHLLLTKNQQEDVSNKRQRKE